MAMGMMGSGYGSECHLLRYLGRHRDLLDRKVKDVIGADSVAWLDWPFDDRRRWQDREWQGLDFLSRESEATAVWERTWPPRGNSPNWDAVGRVQFGCEEAWLLVEAKGNVEELRSSCHASLQGGRPRIEAFLAQTRRRLGVAADRDWLSGYYQFCNRVAVLDLLNQHSSPAHLLHIYFTGDRNGPGRTCPPDVAGWQGALEAMNQHVGLPSTHALAGRMHRLFLPVCETNAGAQGGKAAA